MAEPFSLIREGDITELPGILRTGACAALITELTMNAKTALHLARTIERGLDPVPVLVVDRTPKIKSSDGIFAAVALTLWVYALLSEAAHFIAGWLQ